MLSNRKVFLIVWALCVPIVLVPFLVVRFPPRSAMIYGAAAIPSIAVALIWFPHLGAARGPE